MRSRRNFFRIWSGRWESNPRPKLGKLLYCHCTTPALLLSILSTLAAREQALRLQKRGCQFARQGQLLVGKQIRSGNSRGEKQYLAILRRLGPLPTVHRAIEFAIDWQVGPPIGILGRQRFVKIDAKAWRIAWMHHALGKSVGMRKDAVRLFCVVHIFLNPKIMDAQIKMQRRSHAYGTHVCGTVAPGPDVIEFRQAGDLSQMRNPTGMHNRGPDVVNELLLDELLAIVDRIEDFADRYRRGGVPADEAQTFLQLSRNRIFQPEQVKGFQALSEARR